MCHSVSIIGCFSKNFLKYYLVLLGRVYVSTIMATTVVMKTLLLVYLMYNSKSFKPPIMPRLSAQTKHQRNVVVESVAQNATTCLWNLRFHHERGHHAN